MKSSDIVIIGGGIIGCSIADRLAGEGLKVTVIEKGQPGQEASWAAAGMLAPYAEAAHSVPKPLADLFAASHALYPAFVAELQDQTGILIEYQTTGSILVATDYQESTMLAGLLERQLAADKSVEELSVQQLRKMQPALSDSIQSGLFFGNDHYVNNRQLMKGLVVSAVTRGVEFMSGTPVLGLEFDESKVTGVLTPHGLLSGGMFINAAGAWAGTIAQANKVHLPVRPIRGQMIRLQIQPQSLAHLIHSTGCYIVPWPDGRTLVGSTVENVGFNKDVTAEGIQQLLSAAIRVVPSLKSAAIKDVWAGLRPDTSDNLPILGPTQFSNLIIATGHFRNGILLTPITAKLISEVVTSGDPSISLTPFRPHRFHETDD